MQHNAIQLTDKIHSKRCIDFLALESALSEKLLDPPCFQAKLFAKAALDTMLPNLQSMTVGDGARPRLRGVRKGLCLQGEATGVSNEILLVVAAGGDGQLRKKSFC